MLRCDVSDIQTELDWVHQRLERNQHEFAVLINTAPCWALRLLEQIAADRARTLHLTLLSCGLSTDFDQWADTPMDQRMCEVGFRRVSRRQPLYVRRTLAGLELSDLFSTVNVERSDLDALIAGVRQ